MSLIICNAENLISGILHCEGKTHYVSFSHPVSIEHVSFSESQPAAICPLLKKNELDKENLGDSL